MEEKDAIVAERIIRGLRTKGIPEPFPGMFSLVVKGEEVSGELSSALELLERSMGHRDRAIELHGMLSQWHGATSQAQIIRARLERATRLWFEQFKLDVMASRVEDVYGTAAEILGLASYHVQCNVILWVAKCMVEPIIVPEPCSECHEVMRWDFDQRRLRCPSCERKRSAVAPVMPGHNTVSCHECGSIMVWNSTTSLYRCANCGATSGLA